MKPMPPEAGKELGKDLETFEHLPVKTKELEMLQEQAEKTSGAENAALHRNIRYKAGQATEPLEDSK